MHPKQLAMRQRTRLLRPQVRIQVLACGVCHGDAIVKEGGSFANIEYPRIPGHEVIGIVDKLGQVLVDLKLVSGLA